MGNFKSKTYNVKNVEDKNHIKDGNRASKISQQQSMQEGVLKKIKDENVSDADIVATTSKQIQNVEHKTEDGVTSDQASKPTQNSPETVSTNIEKSSQLSKENTTQPKQEENETEKLEIEQPTPTFEKQKEEMHNQENRIEKQKEEVENEEIAIQTQGREVEKLEKTIENQQQINEKQEKNIKIHDKDLEKQQETTGNEEETTENLAKKIEQQEKTIENQGQEKKNIEKQEKTAENQEQTTENQETKSEKLEKTIEDQGKTTENQEKQANEDQTNEKQEKTIDNKEEIIENSSPYQKNKIEEEQAPISKKVVIFQNPVDKKEEETGENPTNMEENIIKNDVSRTEDKIETILEKPKDLQVEEEIVRRVTGLGKAIENAEIIMGKDSEVTVVEKTNETSEKQEEILCARLAEKREKDETPKELHHSEIHINKAPEKSELLTEDPSELTKIGEKKNEDLLSENPPEQRPQVACRKDSESNADFLLKYRISLSDDQPPVTEVCEKNDKQKEENECNLLTEHPQLTEICEKQNEKITKNLNNKELLSEDPKIGQKEKEEVSEDEEMGKNKLELLSEQPISNHIEQTQEKISDTRPNLIKIQEIEKELKEMKVQILHFSGTSQDTEYLTLNEMLIRNIIKLDDILVENNDEIRTERKRVIKFAQQCLSDLERKVENSKTEKGDSSDSE